MVSWHGYLFYQISRFWENLRRFAFDNRTIFEIIFILIYTFEQGLLIWFTYYINDIIQLTSHSAVKYSDLRVKRSGEDKESVSGFWRSQKFRRVKFLLFNQSCVSRQEFRGFPS